MQTPSHQVVNTVTTSELQLSPSNLFFSVFPNTIYFNNILSHYAEPFKLYKHKMNVLNASQKY